MNTTIESSNSQFPMEVQEVVLLETLKELLTAAIRSLSEGGTTELSQVSDRIKATAEQARAAELNLGHLPLTPAARQQRQKLVADLCRQRSFCRAMLRRWRRSMVLRQQLLDLATGTVTYDEALDPRWCRHE